MSGTLFPLGRSLSLAQIGSSGVTSKGEPGLGRLPGRSSCAGLEDHQSVLGRTGQGRRGRDGEAGSLGESGGLEYPPEDGGLLSLEVWGPSRSAVKTLMFVGKDNPQKPTPLIIRKKTTAASLPGLRTAPCLQNPPRPPPAPVVYSSTAQQMLHGRPSWACVDTYSPVTTCV